MDNDTLEKIMREIAEKIPSGRIASGLAPGEANQRALDAWIKAGGIPGQGGDKFYSLSADDDEEEEIEDEAA